MALEFFDQQCEGPVAPDVLRANLEAALRYGFPMVKKLEPHNRSLAIVGGGPSVSDDLETLRNWKGEVWAANGALGWMLDRGITPAAFVMIDPLAVMSRYLERDLPDITYYIASIADPCIFERLAGKKVILWHVSGKECPPPKGYGAIGGGPTILTKAPLLAFALGFRDVHLFGADSSYDDGDHAYPFDFDLPAPPRQPVELDGVIYQSDAVLLHQVAYFQAIHAWFIERGANFQIHGKGLGPAILNATMHGVEEFA